MRVCSLHFHSFALVLADRGFDIQDSVGCMCAKVKIPAFTKGLSCHPAVSLMKNCPPPNAHLQRVIGTVLNKYPILSDKVQIHMVLPCKDEDMTFLNKIVCMLCSDKHEP